MVISSRTPEGDDKRCPICGQYPRVEPSTFPTRDAPCPFCGSLLWFTSRPEAAHRDSRAGIRRVVDEVARLSDLPLAPEAYYGEFLPIVVGALAAPAGAIWARIPQGDLQLQYQINLRQVGLDKDDATCQTHSELLRMAMTAGRPMLLPPHSSVGQSQEDGSAGQPAGAGNPTDYVILLAPILVGKQVAGFIEVWQDANRKPEAQRGHLQFMMHMANFASVHVSRGIRDWTDPTVAP